MLQNAYKIQLSIAGFSLQLNSGTPLLLEDGYLPFVLDKQEQNPNISMECFPELPLERFKNLTPIFEANNATQRFYSIYKTDEGFGFEIFNQQLPNTIQQIAILNTELTHWKIYSEITNEGIIPLKYPLGPIIMHYMTLKFNAVMMHASCAFDGENARVFSGFSGAGKSTISKIMYDAGNQIINDDRIIIRKINSKFVAYNTPMYYQDYPKQAVLKSIFLIRHAPDNQIKKLDGAMAVSRIMAFAIQNNFDKQFIQEKLEFFSEMCSDLSVYDLGFVPNLDVVPFILSHEN